jgi:hypothetical protein
MSKVKSPPPYTWIPASIGWWFKGPFGRKLAHIWTGSDGIWRGFIFRDGDQIPCGPFLTEEAAMNTLADELHPSERAS